MRRYWITGGIMVATGLATWQFVSYAQPPQDRRESREPDDRRAPPPPRERDGEDLGRALRDENRRAENLMDDARRNLEQAEARLRAAENEFRRLHEDGRGDKSRESKAAEQAMQRARDAMQMAEEHARMAEEHARRLQQDFAMSGGNQQGPTDMRREIRIVHGEGPDRVPMTPEEMRRLQDFRRTIQNYRQEKGAARKDELRAEIQAQLSEQLNRDIEARKEQIDALEKRLDRLRQQVKAAEESKEETVANLIGMLDDGQGPLGISPAWIQALQGGPNVQPFPMHEGFRLELPEFGREMLDRFIPNIDIEVRGGPGRPQNDREGRPAPRPPQPPRRPDAPPEPEQDERLRDRGNFEDDFKPEIELDEDEDEVESSDDDLDDNDESAGEESDSLRGSDAESGETEANI